MDPSVTEDDAKKVALRLTRRPNFPRGSSRTGSPHHNQIREQVGFID